MTIQFNQTVITNVEHFKVNECELYICFFNDITEEKLVYTLDSLNCKYNYKYREEEMFPRRECTEALIAVGNYEMNNSTIKILNTNE